MGEEMHVYFQNSIPQHPTRIETRSEGEKKRKETKDKKSSTQISERQSSQCRVDSGYSWN
jgi:hypothetical protein